MIKEMLGAVVVLIITVGSVFTIVQFEVANGHPTRVVNCSISEFSPDFTPAMRQACREVRMVPIPIKEKQ
jgi:hypothetical protein